VIYDYSPTIQPASGALGAVFYDGDPQYVLFGALCHVSVEFVVANNGTASGGLDVTLPFSPTFDFQTTVGYNNVTGKALIIQHLTGTNKVRILSYDGTHPISGFSNHISFSMTYFADLS
jgi:hypothetical protein